MARSATGDRSPSAPTSASPPGTPVQGTFEELMKKLEGIVVRLERGELSLEESLGAYEEGIGLVRAVKGRLDGMDQRLEELLADGRTAPLAPGAAPSSRNAASRRGVGGGVAQEPRGEESTSSGDLHDDDDGADEEGEG